MIRMKKNKPHISPETKSFRVIRRLNLNRTYTPLKIGAIVGYILLGMLSTSSSLFGIFVGAVLYTLPWRNTTESFFKKGFRGCHQYASSPSAPWASAMHMAIAATRGCHLNGIVRIPLTFSTAIEAVSRKAKRVSTPRYRISGFPKIRAQLTF